MITNADITVFNKRYDKTDRSYKFYPTRIKGVSFYSRKGVSSVSKESSQADTYTIRIPYDADTDSKQYVEQMEYEKLTDEEFPGYWTLQPGAIIIRGLSDPEVATETELQKAYPEVVLISNFTDNREISTNASKHWRVGGR